MVDTVRTKTDLLTNLFQDGQTNGISANDMRDLIVSLTSPMGGMYISSSALTTITASTTYYKAVGTTASTTLSSMTMPVDNRLLYTGAQPRHFHIVSQGSIALASGTNQDIGIQVWHYDDSAASGSLLAHSEARTTIASTNIMQMTTHADVTLDTNDYIEMHVANHSSTADLTLQYGYVFALGMIM